MAQAAEHGIEMIDMVVVNLYAFEKTVAGGADFGTCIENIDIGGPSMLRSAAKNFESVAVVTRPESYDAILAEMRANDGATLRDTRAKLALDVFETTAAYDGAIAAWMGAQLEGEGSAQVPGRAHAAPDRRCRTCATARTRTRRPRSTAATATPNAGALPCPCQAAPGQGAVVQQLPRPRRGLDGRARVRRAGLRHREAPHALRRVPGRRPRRAAYQRAHACDPVSAYGGVMAFNRPVTCDVVVAIFDNKQFVEAIVAPEFAGDALDMYSAKKNARLLSTGGVNPAGGEVEYRSVEGGLLCQDSDAVAEDPAAFTVPTKRQPTDEEMAELLFAWKVCKSIKSNAIAITKGHATIGVGGGQPNRVNSARIAVEQAGDAAQGAVAASDAFFPFRDGLDALAEAGVTAVIEPGGSIRDEEVIAAADEHGIALVFTGHRHFRH